MPLLDHFHNPLRRRLAWEALHSGWATRIADDLNERWLSKDYVAAEFTQLHGRLEVDVVTYEDPANTGAGEGTGTTTLARPRIWSSPRPPHTAPAVFPDSVQVRVMATNDGYKVVAVIELVSPSNKDRPAERVAFVAKCASHLASGACVVIVDIVTDRRANLHNELLRLLDITGPELPADHHLYAVSYRPVLRDGKPELDIWPHALTLGESLPTLPLRLVEDEFVPVELESTYTETCRRRRLIP